MKYISTRGQAPSLDFTGAVTAGLASDGGLYVPEQWPAISTETQLQWQQLDYASLAAQVLQPFAGDTLNTEVLGRMCRDAYSRFSHPAIAPLLQLEENLWIMELFHGPTLAFKDFALQMLGRLFDHILAERGETRTIVGATSGDTGSAAIEAVRGLENVRLFMLHPQGRVSEVQRRQMTTVLDDNIHNIAIDGDFDDCQRLVKEMFNDAGFREEQGLSAVNSINWARIAAQVVYYFRAGLALGAPHRPVSFAVPSGNFGNVFAGYVAMQMGLNIQQFVVGSNRNDILTRFFQSGAMVAESVVPSLSPSMDIQVSSNFERLLFELSGRDASMVRQWMESFGADGQYRIGDPLHRQATGLFSGASLDDDETQSEMKRLQQSSGYLIDPHSAIGVASARQCRNSESVPMIVLATAHPAKFPRASIDATGVNPPLPERVAHIMDSEERVTRCAADLAGLQQLIREAG